MYFDEIFFLVSVLFNLTQTALLVVIASVHIHTSVFGNPIKLNIIIIILIIIIKITILLL